MVKELDDALAERGNFLFFTVSFIAMLIAGNASRTSMVRALTPVGGGSGRVVEGGPTVAEALRPLGLSENDVDQLLLLCLNAVMHSLRSCSAGTAMLMQEFLSAVN